MVVCILIDTPELFDYQKEGVKWIQDKRFALLADEMGLGKSAQVISAAANKLKALPILILCPAVARLNWVREFLKFSKRTLSFAVIMSKANFPEIANADVTICSYDLARSTKCSQALLRRAWSVCVLDEVHYLKNRKAKRSKFVWKSLMVRCGRVWALSGTPSPNHPAELWPLLHAFEVYKLDYWAFVRRYCKTIENGFGTQIVGAKRLDELRALIAPVVLRRKVEDVMKELPPVSFHDVVVEAVEPLGVGIEINSVFDLDNQKNRLEQIAAIVPNMEDLLPALQAAQPHLASIRRWNGMCKLESVGDLIESELEAGAYDKIVVFGIHKTVLEDMAERLKDFGSVLLYGGTPAAKRDKLIDKFQNDPDCRVFVGQITAAGTAISLTAAAHIVFIEADWTPANNQQAIARCRRYGQKYPVNVRFMGIANSIDEKITAAVKRKTQIAMELWDKEDDPFE